MTFGTWRWWGCQPHASRRLYLQEMFLVLIFTRGWVDLRAMVGSEGDMSLKNPVTQSGIDPGTVRLVAQRKSLLSFVRLDSAATCGLVWLLQCALSYGTCSNICTVFRYSSTHTCGDIATCFGHLQSGIRQRKISLRILIVVFPCMLIITQLLFQQNALVFSY
jgi:hypothetical protein